MGTVFASRALPASVDRALENNAAKGKTCETTEYKPSKQLSIIASTVHPLYYPSRVAIVSTVHTLYYPSRVAIVSTVHMLYRSSQSG